MSRISPTYQSLTALQGWTTIDPAVQLDEVMVPSDGRFELASKVQDLGNGFWKYDYVLHNYNSHLSGNSFSVNIPECVEIVPGSLTFRDVPHHSGEPYNSTDWTSAVTSTEVRWDCTETFAQNQNANALRWGTSYNFGFTADAPPAQMDATVGLFRNGSSIAINTQVPDMPCPTCPADVAPPGGDGVITIADVNSILTKFGPCPGCPEDFLPAGGDGQVSIAEINFALTAFGSLCE